MFAHHLLDDNFSFNMILFRGIVLWCILYMIFYYIIQKDSSSKLINTRNEGMCTWKIILEIIADYYKFLYC